jgi:murein L,D-transpeptidase YafK
MKSLLCLLAVLTLAPAFDFKTEQLKNERVKTAYFYHANGLQKQLREKGIKTGELQLYLQAFKHERVISVWVKNITDKKFSFFTEIPFCAGSGHLGPKNQQGDNQIPEGFYYINRFHPESKYLLSLGLNYPNAADRIRSKAPSLGGDIFIHGKCMSIGCIAITDLRIQELYVLAVEAQQNGQTEIPVHIFPARLDADNMEELKSRYGAQPDLMAFWKNLQQGYDYFENQKEVPQVAVNKAGKYTFQ